MRVSVVIVNWNGLDVLRPCLAAIAANTLLDDYEVVVVDNGSHEHGVEDAVRPYPKVRLLREGVNHGFARGNNIGARAARGEFLYFVNNDTLPQQDWLRPLLELQQRWPRAGIVGSRLTDRDGITLHTGYYFDPSVNAYVEALRGFPAGAPQVSQARECEVYAGCGVLIAKQLYEEVGGFGEEYFQGYEDWDLCLKVRAKGYCILYCPESRVVHLENVSMKRLARRDRRRTKERNRAIFEERWRSELYRYRVPRLPAYLGDFGYYDLPRERLLAFMPPRLGRVLEFGCGAGALGGALKRQGRAEYVCGVERHPEAAERAKSRLDRVLAIDIERARLDDDLPFDTLVLADVLEHLQDPWGTLFTARRYLKEGGLVVASLPNIAHYKVIRKLLRHVWRYEPGGILDRTHLRFFTRKSIEDLFLNAGFRIEKVERDGNERWWSRFFGRFSERVKDYTAVQFYVLARKQE